MAVSSAQINLLAAQAACGDSTAALLLTAAGGSASSSYEMMYNRATALLLAQQSSAYSQVLELLSAADSACRSHLAAEGFSQVRSSNMSTYQLCALCTDPHRMRTPPIYTYGQLLMSLALQMLKGKKRVRFCEVPLICLPSVVISHVQEEIADDVATVELQQACVLQAMGADGRARGVLESLLQLHSAADDQQASQAPHIAAVTALAGANLVSVLHICCMSVIWEQYRIPVATLAGI